MIDIDPISLALALYSMATASFAEGIYLGASATIVVPFGTN